MLKAIKVSGGNDAMLESFAGIDVACAKGKRLPVSISVWRKNVLEPLPLQRNGLPKPPQGAGNVRALDDEWRSNFANDAVEYLRLIEKEFGVTIMRIGIDAPSDPKQDGLDRRLAEQALDDHGISCITTPSMLEFDAIEQRVRDHLNAGRQVAQMPHANQLWMLVGFALFCRLREDWECIEVYPHATAALLGAAMTHKSKKPGIAAQLTAARNFTGWPHDAYANPDVPKGIGYGALHDKLDAYLSAWVASTPDHERSALGKPPNDAIGVPKCILTEKNTTDLMNVRTEDR